MEHTVIHDEKVDSFEVFESGQIAYLQYDEKNGVLDILHTIVPPQLEGQGIAQALTEAAVRYASVVGLKIVLLVLLQKCFLPGIPNIKTCWWSEK